MAWHDVPGTILVCVFAIALTVEALLRKPMERLPYEPAANLPGMHELPRTSLERADKVLFSLALTLELLLVISVAYEWSPVISLLTVLAMIGVVGAAAARLKLYRLKHHRMVIAKHIALKKLEPKFFVHWDGPDDGLYQVGMWADYLQRIGITYAVIVRKDKFVAPMARLIGAPVVHAGDMIDVDNTIVPSLRAIVYVNTTVKNAHYIRFTHLKHIQINHGDSDKPASVSPMFRMFDMNFVAGQAAIDRFEHYGVYMPRELVKVVGRPQVASIQVSSHAGGVETVLYAPTWAGFFNDSDFSSLRVAPEIVKELLARGKTVIFRPHAFTNRNSELQAKASEIRTMLARDRDLTGRQHIFGQAAETSMSIIDCFNASDAMIADISSIVSDYLFSEKPVALVAANTSRDLFQTSFPVSTRLPVIDGKLKDLPVVLDDMFGNDTARDNRISAKSYYLGDFSSDGYADHFVDSLREEIVSA